MKKILVVIGSARKGRAADGVAKLVSGVITELGAEAVLADLKNINLPFLDEPLTPSEDDFAPNIDSYNIWSKLVSESDGIVFLTPEYNHGTSGILKNAIDWLYKELQDKPVTLVGYGWSGAPFAISNLSETLVHMKTKQPMPAVTKLCFMKDIDVNGAPIGENATSVIKATISELVNTID